jgi:hypothetical protein
VKQAKTQKELDLGHNKISQANKLSIKLSVGAAMMKERHDHLLENIEVKEN